MSRRITRRASFADAAALLAGGAGVVLAACTPPVTAPGAATPGAQGERTLRVAANTGTGYQLDQWKPIWDAWAQQHPNIKLDALAGVGNTTEWRVKVLTALAGGNVYDVIHPHHVLSGEFMGKDLLKPLDPFIAKDKDVRMDDFPSYLANTYKWRGKQYGLPAEANPWLLAYNADYFAQVGATPPPEYAKTNKWTLDQFIATAKETTRSTGDDQTWGYGGSRGTGYWGWTYWLPAVWAFGGDIWTADNTALALDTKEAQAGLQWYVDLMLKQAVAPPVDQSKLWDPTNGKIGMIPFAPFVVPTFEKYSWKAGMMPLPTGTAGVFHAGGSSSWTIYKGTKNDDIAWTWCKWFTDAGVKAMMDYGYFTAPMRNSLAQYPGWVKSRKPWESADVWAQAIKTFRLPLALPGWDQAITALAALLDQALAGKITVQSAIDQAKGPVGEILRREGTA